MTCIFLIMFSECSLLQSPLRMTQNLRPNASRLVFVIRVELEVLYVNFYIILSSSKNWSKNISYLQINSYGLSITSASPKNVRIYLVKHKSVYCERPRTIKRYIYLVDMAWNFFSFVERNYVSWNCWQFFSHCFEIWYKYIP